MVGKIQTDVSMELKMASVRGGCIPVYFSRLFALAVELTSYKSDGTLIARNRIIYSFMV